MASLQQTNDVDSFRKLLDAGRDIILQIASMPKPVLASVNGVAAGAGCNLALACDYRIASDAAKLSESFVKIGLHPDWGGTWLLPRLVGRGRAFELMATGRMVEAQEALAIGMVDRVVPAAELAAETEKLALTLATSSPLAVAGIKRALDAGERNGLRAQLELEAEQQVGWFQSEEARRQIAASGRRSERRRSQPFDQDLDDRSHHGRIHVRGENHEHFRVALGSPEPEHHHDQASRGHAECRQNRPDRRGLPDVNHRHHDRDEKKYDDHRRTDAEPDPVVIADLGQILPERLPVNRRHR